MSLVLPHFNKLEILAQNDTEVKTDGTL